MLGTTLDITSIWSVRTHLSDDNAPTSQSVILTNTTQVRAHAKIVVKTAHGFVNLRTNTLPRANFVCPRHGPPTLKPSSLSSFVHSHLITSMPAPAIEAVGSHLARCLVSSVLAIPSPSLPDPNQLPRAEPFHMSWYRTSQYKPLPPGKGHIQDGHKNKKDVKTPSNSSSRASSVIPIVVSRNQFDSSKTRAGINVKAGSGGEVKLRPSMPVASMPGAS